MADVNSTNKIWSTRPELDLPQPLTGKGRPRKHARLAKGNKSEYLSVEEWTARHFAQQAREIIYRQETKGDLKAKLWIVEDWTWEPTLADGPRSRLLVVRQDRDGGMKYSLSNFPPGLSWERYAYMQGQRFWVEHAFHEAKGQLGMAQYQVHIWQGWHHHMSLVCMAMLFMLREKLRSAGVLPLLSYRDLTELLDYYLPRRNYSEEEVLRQMQKRHHKRQEDLDRRQKTGLLI